MPHSPSDQADAPDLAGRASPSTTEALRVRVLWTIPLVYLVFVSAEFAAFTHLALTATEAGRTAFEVGCLASALWLGILMSSAKAHGLVARAGHAKVFVRANGLACVAMASLIPHSFFWGWCAALWVLGVAGGLVWVTGEAWLAEAAPPARRGFFVGLFETAVGLGLMIGPALVPLSGRWGWPVPMLSALGMALAWLISGWCLRGAARMGSFSSAPEAVAQAVDADAAKPAAARLPDTRRAALGALLLVAVLSGLMESGVSSMLPSLSMRLGFSLEAAAWLGTVIGAGSALLQPPAGLLADRWGVRRITLLAWACLFLANAVLWLGSGQPQLLWVVGFVLGGVGGAVYTLLIVELGHRLTGTALVRSIAHLVVAYAAGTALGPLLGGLLFDRWGLSGLALVFWLLSAVGALASARGLFSPAPRAVAVERAPPPT